MVYDGDCSFCRFWIARWRERTKGRIAYRRSQQVAERFPEIPALDFQNAVQLIEPGGGVSQGADAVLRAYQISGGEPLPFRAIRSVPFFRNVARIAYRLVANNRTTFSFLTRLLWGGSFRKPRFLVARWLFLRLLGAVDFIAFFSLLIQVRGLIGKRGISPVTDYLEFAREQLGSPRYRLLPTFCWINASDGFLVSLCAAGLVLSAALVFNVWPCAALIGLWACYLSLSVAGQTFLGFQWDALLLEAGLIAIFLVPPLRLRPDWRANSTGSKIAFALLLWLAFRLTFESGLVKLNAPPSANGEQTWRALSALKYHYETQPLPIWTSWYFNQTPLAWHKFSIVVMFAVELAAPFTILAPARVRRLGCGAMVALQGLIAASGNFCFFNLLTASLYVLLLDDDVWPARWRLLAKQAPERLGGWPAWVVAPFAAVCASVTTMQLAGTMNLSVPWPRPLASLYSAVAPFRSLNNYGLFAVMTTSRPEIIIEGSNDRIDWRAYEFRWKPGDVTRPPGLVAPHQPRLDWQMWFAALGSVRENPWFVNFLARLLEGSPDVLALLGHNPFPDAPPRFVRALLYDYKFTRHGEDPRAWWKRELIGTYCPAVSQQDFAPAPTLH
jgi:predicted DCC family thiol-disulfide oxidoreductase YuxK